jgi:hypothetical protein
MTWKWAPITAIPTTVDDAWIRHQVPGMRAHDGFDNLVTSFLYWFIRDAQNELAMSVARRGGFGIRNNVALPCGS